MQYGTFRRQGFFIGSGVVEAGGKTVIGARCKQSGMFWGKLGAENIPALRCIHSSRRLDEFWKEPLNARAARSDALPPGGVVEEFCLTPVPRRKESYEFLLTPFFAILLGIILQNRRVGAKIPQEIQQLGNDALAGGLFANQHRDGRGLDRRGLKPHFLKSPESRNRNRLHAVRLSGRQ